MADGAESAGGVRNASGNANRNSPRRSRKMRRQLRRCCMSRSWSSRRFTPTVASRRPLLGTDQVLARMQEGPVWVALREGAVLGTVAAVVKGESVYIRGMAVLPSARGSGAGASTAAASGRLGARRRRTPGYSSARRHSSLPRFGCMKNSAFGERTRVFTISLARRCSRWRRPWRKSFPSS